MTWQQTETKRYNDHLRDRWNTDGTRRLKKDTISFVIQDYSESDDIKRMSDAMREASKKISQTPSTLMQDFCDQ